MGDLLNELLTRLLSPDKRVTVLTGSLDDEGFRGSLELKAKSCGFELSFADLRADLRPSSEPINADAIIDLRDHLVQPVELQPLLNRICRERERACILLITAEYAPQFRQLLQVLSQVGLGISDFAWESEWSCYVLGAKFDPSSVCLATQTRWCNEAFLTRLYADHLTWRLDRLAALRDQINQAINAGELERLEPPRLRNALRDPVIDQPARLAEFMGLLREAFGEDEEAATIEVLTGLVQKRLGDLMPEHESEIREIRAECATQKLRFDSLQQTLQETRHQRDELSAAAREYKDLSLRERRLLLTLLHGKMSETRPSAGGNQIVLGDGSAPITVHDTPHWVSIPVHDTESYRFGGTLSPLEERRDALVRVRFLDRDAALIPGEYSHISMSPKLGPYRYLEPDGPDRFVLDIPAVPSGAAWLCLGFQTWRAKEPMQLVPQLSLIDRADPKPALAEQLHFQPLRQRIVLDEYAIREVGPHVLEGLVIAHPDERPDAAFLELTFLDEIGRRISPPYEGLVTGSTGAPGLPVPTKDSGGLYRLRIDVPHTAARINTAIRPNNNKHQLYCGTRLTIHRLRPEDQDCPAAAVLRFAPDQPTESAYTLERQPVWLDLGVEEQDDYVMHVRVPAHVQTADCAAILRAEFHDMNGCVVPWEGKRFSESQRVGTFRYVGVTPQPSVLVADFKAPLGARTLRLGFQTWKPSGEVRLQNEVVFGKAEMFSELMLGSSLVTDQASPDRTGGIFAVQMDGEDLRRVPLHPNGWLYQLALSVPEAIVVDSAEDLDLTDWRHTFAHFGAVEADALHRLLTHCWENRISCVLSVRAGMPAPPQSMAHLASVLAVSDPSQVPPGVPPNRVHIGRWQDAIRSLRSASASEAIEE